MPNDFDALAASNKEHARLFALLNTLPVAGVLYPVIIGGRPQRDAAATELVKKTLAAYLELNPIIPPENKENDTPHDDTDSQIPRNDTKSHVSNSSKTIPHAANCRMPSDTTNLPMPSDDTHVNDTNYPEPDIDYYSPPPTAFTELPELQPPLPQSAQLPQAPQAPPISVVNSSASPAPATTQPPARVQKLQTPQALNGHPVGVANPPAQTTNAVRPQPRATRPQPQRVPQAQNVAPVPPQSRIPKPTAQKPQAPQIVNSQWAAVANAPVQTITAARATPAPYNSVVFQEPIVVDNRPPPPPKRKATEEASTRNVKPKQTLDDLLTLEGDQLGPFILSLGEPPVLPAGYVLAKRTLHGDFSDFVMFSTRTGVPPVLPVGFVKVGEGVLRRLQNMLRQWTAQKKKEQEAARNVGVPINAHHNAGAAAPQQPARLTGPPMPTAPQFPFGAPNNVGVAVTPAPPIPQRRPAPPMPTAPAASKFLGFFPISTPSTVRSAAAAAPPPKAVKPPKNTRAMPSQSRAPATNAGAAAAPTGPVTQPSHIPVPAVTQFTFTAPSNVGAAAAPQAPSTASHPHQSDFTRPPSAMPGNVGVTIPPQMTAGPSSLASIPAQNFWNMPSGQADMNMEPVDFFGITL